MRFFCAYLFLKALIFLLFLRFVANQNEVVTLFE